MDEDERREYGAVFMKMVGPQKRRPQPGAPRTKVWRAYFGGKATRPSGLFLEGETGERLPPEDREALDALKR